MKACLFLLTMLVVAAVSAQLPIGHRTIDFTDASRTRTIPCELYYPGTMAGEDVDCAPGTFPIIVFGHGYSMDYDSYMNFTDTLVPRGYIIAMPTTESGLSPDHGAFGLDLKFVNDELKSQALTNNSFFLYNHFNGYTALAGHSMGGGASFLAAAGNSNITTVITFAAAETDPSAIAAAATITVPVLIFQGENDGVAPPADHQIPMYNALTTDCKYKVNIVGGGHCYFANYNLACSTAEFFTTPSPTISREEQHTTQFNVLIPYLHWQLKDDVSYKIDFEDSIQNSSEVSAVFSCGATTINENEINVILFPNPASEYTTIHCDAVGEKTIQIFDLSGRLLSKTVSEGNEISVSTNTLQGGLYVLEVRCNGKTFNEKLLIQPSR